MVRLEVAQGRARGQVLRQTGLSSEGLGGIGRVQGGPWRGRRLYEVEVGQATRSGGAAGEGIAGVKCVDRRYGYCTFSSRAMFRLR